MWDGLFNVEKFPSPKSHENIVDGVVELTFWKLIIGLQLTSEVEKIATTIGKLKSNLKTYRKLII